MEKGGRERVQFTTTCMENENFILGILTVILCKEWSKFIQNAIVLMK